MKRHLITLALDCCGLAGLAATTYGFWILHPAVAWIVAGIALMCVGIIGARRWA